MAPSRSLPGVATLSLRLQERASAPCAWRRVTAREPAGELAQQQKAGASRPKGTHRTSRGPRRPGAPSPTRARPAGPRSKPVRITLDLSPELYRELTGWADSAAVGVPSVSLADAVRAMIRVTADNPDEVLDRLRRDRDR